MVMEKSKREEHTGGIHTGKISPMPLSWKTRGAEFHDFLQPEEFKTWHFKSHQLGWDRALMALFYCWREGRQTTWQTVWK